MAEYFDLLSPTGEPLGITKERNAVHRDGDWHPSVHIFVVQGDRVLLQRRKWDKESFPGKLDLACTGHVDAGEDYLTAARRELQEELNLSAGADDLRYLFTQKLEVDADFWSRPLCQQRALPGVSAESHCSPDHSALPGGGDRRTGMDRPAYGHYRCRLLPAPRRVAQGHGSDFRGMMRV